MAVLGEYIFLQCWVTWGSYNKWGFLSETVLGNESSFFASFCPLRDFLLKNLELRINSQIWGFESVIFWSKFHFLGDLNCSGSINYLNNVLHLQPDLFYQHDSHSMLLRRVLRWYFPQVWIVFNLDVHCIFCVQLIYFRKTFHLNYVFNVNSIFNMFRF